MNWLIFLVAQGDEIRDVLTGASIFCAFAGFPLVLVSIFFTAGWRYFLIAVFAAFAFSAGSSLVPSSETAAAMLRTEAQTLPPAERASIEALIAQALKKAE